MEENPQLSMLVEHFFQGYSQTGKVFVVNHLRSDKGKTMNGRRAIVVGADTIDQVSCFERRIHVRLLDPNNLKPTGKKFQIKPKNLVPKDQYCAIPSKPTISEEDTLRLLNEGMKQARAQRHHIEVTG